MKLISSNLEKLGKDGEGKAVEILKSLGFVLARPDFSGYKEFKSMLYNENLETEEDVEFEIKTKSEPFKPPPFLGHGADLFQIKKRMRRYKKYGIKQFLLIIQKDDKVYGQWLHKLENGKYFDTRLRKRIYPLSNFEEIPKFIWKKS